MSDRDRGIPILVHTVIGDRHNKPDVKSSWNTVFWSFVGKKLVVKKSFFRKILPICDCESSEILKNAGVILGGRIVIFTGFSRKNRWLVLAKKLGLVGRYI